MVNDFDYEYRLSYVDADTNTIGNAVVSSARPGPEVGWVADAGADEVVRFTPDARARVLTVRGVRRRTASRWTPATARVGHRTVRRLGSRSMRPTARISRSSPRS